MLGGGLAIPILGDLLSFVVDHQEYIIYVNDKAFDLAAFEAQFNSAYSARAYPSAEQS